MPTYEHIRPWLVASNVAVASLHVLCYHHEICPAGLREYGTLVAAGTERFCQLPRRTIMNLLCADPGCGSCYVLSVKSGFSTCRRTQSKHRPAMAPRSRQPPQQAQEPHLGCGSSSLFLSGGKRISSPGEESPCSLATTCATCSKISQIPTLSTADVSA